MRVTLVGYCSSKYLKSSYMRVTLVGYCSSKYLKSTVN